MVILAHWRAQSYKFEQYTDLWDFCQILGKLTDGLGQNSIAEACKGVQRAIDNSVGRQNGNRGRQDYEGIDFQHSHGLSVFFPWSSATFLESDQDTYKKLAFGRDTRWGDFLDKYLEATKRERRPIEDRSGIVRIFGDDADDEKAKDNSQLQHASQDHRNAPHTGRNAPHTGRNAPHTGRNAPHTGRNAPHTGRNAPHTGRMLQLFLDSINASMKNPPQSVYLRLPRQYRDSDPNASDESPVSAGVGK
jgi:hypothetical protein